MRDRDSLNPREAAEIEQNPEAYLRGRSGKLADAVGRNILASAVATTVAVLSPDIFGVAPSTTSAIFGGLAVYTGLKAIGNGQRDIAVSQVIMARGLETLDKIKSPE